MDPTDPSEIDNAESGAFVPRDRKAKQERSTEELLANLNHSLPFSDDAEKGVISGLLNDPQRLTAIRAALPLDAFYHAANRIIYQQILEFEDLNIPMDVTTLTHAMRAKQVIDKIGGPGAISDLYSLMPIGAHFAFYVKIMQDKFALRRVIHVCTLAIHAAFDHGREHVDEDVIELIDQLEGDVFAIAEICRATQPDHHRAEFKSQKEVLLDVVDEMNRIIEHKGEMLEEHVATGFTDLDRMTGGLKAGQLMIVAARPAQGKTSLVSNLAHKAALGATAMDYKDGLKNVRPKRVAFISLEMGADEILMREYVGGSGVDLTAMRSGLPLRRDQQADLQIQQRVLMNADIQWLDTPGITVQTLRGKLRKLKSRRGLDIIIIDYLQLLKSSSRRAKGNREQEIADISATLKEMAKELQVPVLVLAQLNRKAEDRKDGRPELSDLRESGSIEQDADIVGLLWRGSYYNEELPEEETRLIIAKHRGGPVGDIVLKWEARRTQFTSTCFYLHSNNEANRQQH